MSPRTAARAALLFALSFATLTARDALAQQQFVASGQRLLTVTQRVPDSEGDRHSLRTRIQETAITRRSVRCAALTRGQPFGVPVSMSDGTLTLVTQSPAGVAWFADGQLVRQIYVNGTIYGTPIEGADGRVIVVDDTPSVRAYAPDGSLRSTATLPGVPLYGASALNDGTLLVPLAGSAGSDLAIVSADLAQQSRIRLPGTIANHYFYRGTQGSLWFNTNVGPFSISGNHPTPEALAWARTAAAAWQTDDDTLVVQFGSTGPSELRFASRTGAVRGSVPFVDQIFLLPRGHIALAQPHFVDPSTSTSTSTTGGASSGGSGTTTVPVVRPPGRPPYGRTPAVERTPTHTELVVYDRRGAAVTRTLLPPQRLLSVLLDPDDGALVVSVTGRAFAVDPGGTLRWESDLGIVPAQDVIALPDGGFAMSVTRPRPGVCVIGG
jgi:hypothetical protein